eukprot:TRINITY_DN15395_c0_g1_i1.p2 TRINITY_DN15395_c0_g1~~TRINITY_DN15395_c0_g1_i1.p2  ORF type:complete len:392 (+),score=167.45 TRINITY_DN15395_c0_g1_i1:81-1256(+)
MSREEQAQVLFTKFDLDGSGTVEWDEFVTVLRGCEAAAAVPEEDLVRFRGMREKMLDGGAGLGPEDFAGGFARAFGGKSDADWAALVIALCQAIDSGEKEWYAALNEERKVRSPTLRRLETRGSHMSFEKDAWSTPSRPTQEQMLYLFDKWDLDGSGVIEWDEFSQVLKECEASVQLPKRDKKLLAKMKVKMWEGGKARGLSQREFTTLMDCLFGAYGAEEWTALFHKFCGAIDAMKEGWDPEGVKRLLWLIFRVLDADLDGEVEYAMLLKVLSEKRALTKHEKKCTVRWQAYLQGQQASPGATPVRISLSLFLRFMDDFLADHAPDAALDKLEEVHDVLRERNAPLRLLDQVQAEKMVDIVGGVTSYALMQQREDPLDSIIEYLTTLQKH